MRCYSGNKLWNTSDKLKSKLKSGKEDNIRLCRMFHNKDLYKYTKEKKIEILKVLSKIKLTGNKQSYKNRRKKQYYPIGNCMVCLKFKSTCKHHIILLKNGGYNGKFNTVFICDYCHSEIHEWLDKPKLTEENLKRMTWEDFFNLA